ncbi:MAG: S-layer homology domain-containing protein [Candidatus Gracilibacteria bacterium]
MSKQKIHILIGLAVIALVSIMAVFLKDTDFLKSDLVSSGSTIDTSAAFTDYGIGLTSLAFKYGTIVKNEAGEHEFYGVIAGNPESKFIRFNLTKLKLEQELPVPAKSVWKMHEHKGKIYFGTVYPGRLMEYSPTERTLKVLGTLPAVNEYIWELAIDDNNIYMGTYSGDPYRYEFATGKMISLGHHSEAKYSRCITVLNGKVYIGYGGARRDTKDPIMEIVELDMKTGIAKNILPPEYRWLGIPAQLNAAGGKIIFASGSTKMLEYTPETGVWRYLFNGGNIFGAPATGSGTDTFSGYAGALFQYTKNASKPLKRVSSYAAAASIVNNEKILLVTADGSILEQDFTGKTISASNLADYGVEGVTTQPFSIAAYKGKVALAEVRMRIFDTLLGQSMLKEVPGEPKVIEFVKDTLYTANYTSTDVWRYDQNALALDSTDDYNSIEKFRAFTIASAQTRPKDIAVKGEKLLIGTEPNYAAYGGAMTFYNTETKEKYTSVNIVQDHTINVVAFDRNNSDIAYLGSSAAGGTGATNLPQNAHVVKWDIKEKKVLFDIIPEIPASGYNYNNIDIVSKGNKVYVLTSRSTLFVLDSTTGAILSTKTGTGMNNMMITSDGTIYTTGTNGFGTLSEDTLTQNIIKSNFGVTYHLFTEDLFNGDIYMINGRNLWKFDSKKYKQIITGTVDSNDNQNTAITENTNTNSTSQTNTNSGSTLDTNLNTNTNLPNLNTNSSNTNINSVILSNSNGNFNLNTNTVAVNPPVQVTLNTGSGSNGGGSTYTPPQQSQNTTINSNQNLKSSTSQAITFTDISNNFAADAIVKLAEMGIVQGRSQGRFEPNETLNRAEAVKLAVKTFMPEENEQNFLTSFKGLHSSYSYVYFPDVLTNVWYAGFIGIAKEKNIVEGTSKGTFEPARNVTRAEFLKIVMNSTDKQSFRLYNYRDQGFFTDIPENAWFENNVFNAAQLSIIDARAKFEPERPITRAEAAKILFKAKSL